MPPRQLIAKDEKDHDQGIEDAVAPKSGKRKAVSSACIPCRRRKSKCDGGQPACSTCLAVYRTECNYDSETEARRKSSIPRKDVQTPSQSSSQPSRHTALDAIISNLKLLPERDAIGLLNTLRTDARIEDIAASLASAQSHGSGTESPVLSHDFGPSKRPSITSFSSQQASSSSQAESSRASSARHWNEQHVPRIPTDAASFWSRVPQDPEYVEHLLNLYFAWQHPFNPVFSTPHFQADMQSGRDRYCSSLLLNAVLSLACNYSDATPPHESTSSNAMGDFYFAEAEGMANQTQEARLTTIQALAVMSLREKSCGRDASGYRYAGRALRMAMEVNLHLARPSEREPGLGQVDVEIRKLTFWGVYNVETMSALSIGRVSQIQNSCISVEKPADADRLDSLIWQPYEDVNLPISPHAQHAMHCLAFIQKLSDLSHLVNEYNLALYAPGEQFTMRRLHTAQNRYRAWYDGMPSEFLLQNTSMPHIIVLHMYYHYCVMHLFRPFLKLDCHTVGLYPRAICTYSAGEISTLTNALRSMHGLRRVCIAAIGIIGGSGAIHLLNSSDPTASVNLAQTFSDLWSLSVNHPLANVCIEVLRVLSMRWNIALPENIASLSPLRNATSQGVPLRFSSFQTHAALMNEYLDTDQPPESRSRFDSAFNYPVRQGQPDSANANVSQVSGVSEPLPWTQYLGQDGMLPPQEYTMTDNASSMPFHYQSHR